MGDRVMMTLEPALADLRDIGFDDAAVTGIETPIPGHPGETRILWSSRFPFDHPWLLRSASGDVRVMPWTYGFGLGPE